MSVNKQLNMQISNEEEILAPLRKLNLLDDFLFDVATVDLETCKIILELSLGIHIKKLSWQRGTESRPQYARMSRHPHGFLCRSIRRNRI